MVLPWKSYLLILPFLSTVSSWWLRRKTAALSSQKYTTLTQHFPCRLVVSGIGARISACPGLLWPFIKEEEAFKTPCSEQASYRHDMILTVEWETRSKSLISSCFNYIFWVVSFSFLGTSNFSFQGSRRQDNENRELYWAYLEYSRRNNEFFVSITVGYKYVGPRIEGIFTKLLFNLL